MLSAFSFHGYGFIIGLAVVVVWQFVERLSQKWPVPQRLATGWLGVAGAALVGARVWHIWTDWSYYQPLVSAGQWWQVLAVWQGGLSVLGALVGMLLVIKWWSGRHWRVGTDVLVLALPWGQVIGRLANWWNQELYGLPTSLPWGIWIDPAHRLASVAEFSYFHPLFAYEALGVALLGAWLWRRQNVAGWQPGSGRLTWVYLAAYSWGRFFLDFLRVDRPVLGSGLSQNQWCLVVAGAVSLFLLGKSWLGSWSAQARLIGWLSLVIMVSGGVMLGTAVGKHLTVTQPLHQVIQATPDGAEVQVRIFSQDGRRLRTTRPLLLRLAKTEPTRAQGLSGLASLPGDGMMFWFDRSDKWLFWMKDMQFNLDFVWVRQGQVVGVTPQVSAPQLVAGQPVIAPLFGPPTSVDLVLELAAGTASQLTLQTGDLIQLQLYPK